MRVESRESRAESRKLEAGVRRMVAPSSLVLRPSTAFTLLEMLTVLAIMGIIAALVVPALKNFGQSDAMTAADQQMLGAVARARQLAMSQRTTVYLVFVRADFWAGLDPGALTSAQQTAATNLAGYQLAGYTFMSYGQAGDQPGQHRWHYLAPWQSLPPNTFIATNKFMAPYQTFNIPLWDSDYHNGSAVPIYGFDTNNFISSTGGGFPIPTEDSRQSVAMPFIAFNYLGQLTTNGVDMASAHTYIPLARGDVMPAIAVNTRTYVLENPPAGMPSVSEMPPGNSTNAYNIINIDPLTGRAALETPKIK